MAQQIKNSDAAQIKFFDGFTKTMLIVMVSLLLIIFVSAKIIVAGNMTAEGTDATVNDMAGQSVQTDYHPFTELPGDAEVGAFTVTAFFAGLIVGHNWEKLFGKKALQEVAEKKEQADEHGA